MKKSVFILLAICLMGTACEKKEQSLVNSKWKLVGIMDLQKGSLTELLPKDCEQCYTLIFVAEDTLTTWSHRGEYTGIYNANYKTNNLKIISLLWSGGLTREIWYGAWYLHSFQQIQSFSLQKKKKELWLYYNDKKNYLLFKKIEI